YIRRPSSVFYSPVIIIAVAVGLLFGLRWRRSLAAQYIFGTTALGMLLFFTPGLTELVDKFGSFITLLVMIFILPVSLALGLGIDALVNWVSQRLPARFVQIGFSLAAILGMFVLLFEPFPISASAHDQLNAYNTVQRLRLLHPSQIALVESLHTH